MSKDNTVVLLDKLSDHCAVQAWRTIERRAEPTSVEVLKPENRSSAVFRLKGVGPAGASVIAKRRKRGELDLERHLYATVLPSLSVPTLEVFGFVESAADDQSWIFLEDAGELWYAPAEPEHREFAVRWLADLHTRSSECSTLVPETGSAYFRSVLDAGLDGVHSGLAHARLSQSDRSVLRSIVSHLELAAHRWEDVEAACAAAPRGVVHGDFVPKNVRVRQGRAGAEIVAFDWEWAGVASPAADVGLLPEHGESLRHYHALASEAWPNLSWHAVQVLARTGRLLRLLNCSIGRPGASCIPGSNTPCAVCTRTSGPFGRPSNQAHGWRSEMTQTVDRPGHRALERSLEAALREPDGVAVTGREPNSYASTFPSDIVTCVAGPRTITLLCKYEVPRDRGLRGVPVGIRYESAA